MKANRDLEKLFGELLPWVEKSYPGEGCGLVLETEEGLVFRQCENVIDKYHQVDPEAYPRTSKDFYMIDPREFLRAEREGHRVAVIVHSHPDVGDYFSESDVAAAVMPRESAQEPMEPLYPGTDYLVVSVREGKADGASLFGFEEESQNFELRARYDEKALNPPN